MFEQTLEEKLTKMLIEEGCTVNKRAMKKLADYVCDTGDQLIQDVEGHLERLSKSVEFSRPKNDRQEND